VSRKSTNILFADVKGYSSLNENQLLAFAQQVLPRAAEQLTDHECHHVNTWGDGLVVAVSSVRSIAAIALGLRDLFERLDWEDYHLPPLSIRISIHHGEYYQGEDPFTKGGLVTGRTIIRAARIEPVAKPGMIWVTEAVEVALRDDQKGRANPRFATDLVGDVELAKGAGTERIFSLRRHNDATLATDVRDEILAENAKRSGTTPKSGGNAVENFEACLGVVIRRDEVLLVRRQLDQTELSWGFPAAKKQPLDNEQHIVVREVRRETGVDCTLREKIATLECHSLTGAKCHYYHLTPVNDAEPENRDNEENADARYVLISDLEKYIPQHLNPEVAQYLRQTS
jgi:class 3 adenylate cyclase/ADP-ribose pyrophosphatase YjhB (NUDIX family)